MANPTDTSAIQFLTKRRYAPFIVAQENVEPMLFEKIGRVAVEYDSKGDSFFIPVVLPGGESVGAYREGGKTPLGESLAGTQAFVKPKLNAMVIEITGLSKANTKKGLAAFVNGLDYEVERKSMYARNDMSRQMHGNGRGVLGVLAAAPTNVANSVVTFVAGTNMENFRVSMRVDIWTSDFTNRRIPGTDNTTEDLGAKIIAVNKDALTVTLDADVITGVDDAAAGDVMVRQNVGIGVAAAPITAAEGNEITGLEQLIQAGGVTAVFQGVTLASFPDYTSIVDSNGGVGRNVSEDHLWRVGDKVETRGGGKINAYIMGKGLRRKLLAIGLTNVRHESEKFGLGYTSLTFNGKELYVDRQAKNGTIYMGEWEQLGRGVIKEWGSADVSPGGERMPRFDKYELLMNTYMNVFIKQSNRWGVLQDLIEPAS